MHLSPALRAKYTAEQYSAREAQRLAEVIAWGPAVFQASRLMIEWGVFELLRNHDEGLTEAEVAQQTQLSTYATKCLLEASLTIGTVLINPETDRYTLSKVGWFLLNDPATRVNIDFNHDVNYEGWYHLGQALREGRPAGLEHFGSWATVYEGLSSLPKKVQQSWFNFDHFYSDSAFPQALEIVFKGYRPKRLYDIGGNTGKWALQCVNYDPEVEVTILDLPQQIELMRAHTTGKPGAERITGQGLNLLDAEVTFPQEPRGVDAIWMSQFLDCFGEDEIVSILSRARRVMQPSTRLFIMETLWDRQRFEPAAFCLTMTSLYFTAIANGNSKMYHSEDLIRLISEAELEVEHIHDHLGQGHSILVCKLKSSIP